VGSVYRAVYSGLKPQALTKIKDQKIIEFVCSCLEEDVNKRLSSSALLNHPFLTETESDGEYISICSDEQLNLATLIIGTPPTKQGWEVWIQKIVVPIRESRQRHKNNSFQHASPVSDVILDYEPEPSQTQTGLDTKNQVIEHSVEYQPRTSDKVFKNNEFKKEEEDHDVILDDEPSVPPRTQNTTKKTDSPNITPVAIQNIERVESTNNSSRVGTPHTTTATTVQFSTPPPGGKDQGSNDRWQNQMAKNLQELQFLHRENPQTISSQSLPSTLHTTALSSPASNRDLASSLIEHKHT
jgi:serine/threonine protein kinase